MDNNVDFVLDLLLCSSGKEIEEFTREHAYVILAANKKIYVKFVHQIQNSDYRCKLEIKDVDKMGNI